MKITIVSTLFPYRGGIADFNDILVKELSNDHEVRAITFKRQYPSLLFPGKTQFRSDSPEGTKKAEMLVDSINPFNWIKIGNMIKKEKPDLLLFRYWLPFFGPCFGKIADIVRKNNHTKVCIIADNVIPHEKKPGDVAFTKYFFKKADSFVLLSEAVKNDLLDLFPEAKHKLLYHPVYSHFGEGVEKGVARAKLQITEEHILLFFGFIREYKGLDTLLEAMAILKGKLKLHLVIAGEFYSNEEKYQSLIKKLNLEDSVSLFSDFIPENEVKYYFSAADVLVMPYIDATQSGIAQIAYNFQKPVIATKVGGLHEVVEDGKTGYLVEKNNPKELAEAIKIFYEEQKESEFVTKMKSEPDKFSWNKFIKQFIDFVG